MNVASAGEKVFEYYLDLPSEVRDVLINEMRPDDRCRFIRTSKQSGKEVRSSKNFFYGLELDAKSQNEINVEVRFHKTEPYGCTLKFKRESKEEKNTMTSYNLSGVALVEYTFHDEETLFDLAVGCFCSTLKAYQNHIKKISIQGKYYTTLLDNVDYEIENLKSLEVLTLDQTVHVRKIMPHIQKPLKELEWTRPNEEFHGYLEMILATKDVLRLPFLEVSKEQLGELKASHFLIHIGQLTEENIFKYINSWQNGDLKTKTRSGWYLAGSEFDVRKLFLRFGKELNGESEDKVDIHHQKEPRQGILSLHPKGILIFATPL